MVIAYIGLFVVLYIILKRLEDRLDYIDKTLRKIKESVAPHEDT